MSGNQVEFELPKKIERYLAVLSKLYAQDGKRSLQELIVNAQARVHEGWSHDNLDGGIDGHRVYLVIPETLYLSIVKQRHDIQQQIGRDLNEINDLRNEFIEEVVIEMEAGETGEWRQESGLLIAGTRRVSPEGVNRVWWDSGFRLFISHKSEVKKETASLKDGLRLFGISAFMAHEDIHPTKIWQHEIENALATMDGFVALMTEGFHNSDWTDQEVGFALARSVPIIAVRLGADPYGFLGKFQGLPSTWATAAEDIVKLLIKHDRVFSAYVQAVRDCTSFDEGNRLSHILPNIKTLNDQQIDELVAAYNGNGEVRGSFGFSGGKPQYWGPGLVTYLNQLGSRQFVFSDSRGRLIELVA